MQETIMFRSDLFHLLRTFRAVVENRSFSGAAQSLGIQPPAVSKAIAKLEADLGVQLLVRSTRAVSLTDSGELFHREVERILSDLEDARSVIQTFAGEPVGALRVSATVAFGQRILSPLLPRFMNKYPGITIDLRLTNDILSLHGDDVDLVLRSTPELEDSSNYTRLISTQDRMIVVAPDYLRKHGPIGHPEKLAGHRCLAFRANRLFDRWTFSKDGVSWTVRVKPILVSNDYQTLLDAAVQGAGIAQLFRYQAQGSVERGELVHLLDSFELPKQNIYAIYRQKRRHATKVDAFVGFLEEALEQLPTANAEESEDLARS
ncbi:LysR family transcriptional regulator [Erythrobacter mangrovi]|uniref:LysR family transcriptional regulator n=1 Tax=Erythrobacter mangrovi TaxID=2739433 RepID=A0A7D4AUC5_9SPHN|nr:LysR family transcriptional regulator [Erythrobacter mangrovi]QKG71877.1 LysR family transcriptional regulator [Erythrobacter mangrovi]